MHFISEISGRVVPFSQREILLLDTPSFSASCSWVRKFFLIIARPNVKIEYQSVKMPNSICLIYSRCTLVEFLGTD